MAANVLPAMQFRQLSEDEGSPFGGILQKALMNYKALTENKYLDQEKKQGLDKQLADTLLAQANAKRANAQADLPFGGANLPGPAGQIAALEALRLRYGEDSPQYKAAKNLFDSIELSRDSSRRYQGALTDTLPRRILTKQGKETIEQANVAQNLAPSGQTFEQSIGEPRGFGNQSNMQGQLQELPGPRPEMNSADLLNSEQLQKLGQPGSPAQPTYNQPQRKIPVSPLAPDTGENLANGYALARQKDQTDLDTRKRDLFAQNIRKTIENIPVDDLVHYSGITGSLKEAGDHALNAFGFKTPTYDKAQEAAAAAKAYAKQIRQFYGDSIQPSVQHDLEILTNPTSWSRSPELAKKLFLKMKGVVDQELSTIEGALKSKEAYTSGEKSKSLGAKIKSSGEVKRLKFNPATGQLEEK